jgi:hypothetical protein
MLLINVWIAYIINNIVSLLQNFSFATATAEKCSFVARRAKNCKGLCKTNRVLQQARYIIVLYLIYFGSYRRENIAKVRILYE